MTDPVKPVAGQPLSAEGAALLEQEQLAANATQPSPAADQAATAAAIAAAQRGPVLPAETELDAFMAQVKADYARVSAELEALKSQQAAALVAGGGPLAVRYAQGAADKVAALVAAHPDAPPGHFAAAVTAAETLAAEAQKLVKSGGSAGVLQSAGAALEKFAVRTHWRTWGKHIDWSAILDDTETAVEEGLKLAA